MIASVFTDDKMIFISTHQISDLDNLIDNVIIVDNGELLLNAQQKLEKNYVLKLLNELPDETAVLYEEPSLKGNSIVIENKTGKNRK